MSHLDEGTLHALLDGELSNQEVREIQAHLGSCSACGTRLQSVKEVMAESEKLVGAIQFPGTPRRPAALDPAPPEPTVESTFSAEPAFEPSESEYVADAPDAAVPVRAPRGPDRRPDAQPVYDEPPPVLLVPEDSQWGERRRRVVVGMRWAALVAVAVGAGYIASEVRRTSPMPIAPTSSAAPAFDDSVGPVVSAEETVRPDSGPMAGRFAESTANEASGAEDSRRALRKAETPPRASAPAPAPARESVAQPSRLDRTATGPVTAAKAAADEDEDQAPAADEAPQTPSENADLADAGAAPSPDVRAEAAEALAELDRQRRIERAAAATAALDAAARRRQAVQNAGAVGQAAPAPAPAAPAPRTLEQRSGIYLRIGLDEAARQLGRPVHVIEGMQQQFMGLAQGANSPGAEGARPVVRVVYQDNQGRMILLDQQRLRPGQTWGSGETRWVAGEIGLALLGEPGPEILRNLRARVR